MSTLPPDKRYAPPSAEVADVASDGDGTELAGRGARLGAALIDVLVSVLAVWVISLVTPWQPFTADAESPLMQMSINTLLGYVVFMLVQGYLLATRGQTIGKLLLDMRIVRSNGERASFARIALLRYGVGTLLTAIPTVGQLYGLIDVLLIFRQSRKCLHDNIADTIVVKV